VVVTTEIAIISLIGIVFTPKSSEWGGDPLLMKQSLPCARNYGSLIGDAYGPSAKSRKKFGVPMRANCAKLTCVGATWRRGAAQLHAENSAMRILEALQETLCRDCAGVKSGLEQSPPSGIRHC